MSYTYAEALAEAAKRTDLAGLLDVLRNTAATVEGAPTNATSLLYGGDVYGKESFKVSDALVKSSAGEAGAARLVRIDESSVGRLLLDDKPGNFQSLVRAAITNELKATVAGFDQLTQTAKEALINERFNQDFFGKDPNGNRLPVNPAKPSMWDIASGNWVDQAKGNFRLVVGKVSEASILLQTELPKLIAKVGNFFVDGVDIKHLQSLGPDGGLNAMVAEGIKQTHATLVDLSPDNLTKFKALTPDGMFSVLGDVARYMGLVDLFEGLPPELLARVKSGRDAIKAGAEALAKSGLPDGLNKLGIGAILFGVVLTASAATKEYNAGNTAKSLEIVKEWATEFAGGLLGGIAGQGLATLVVGLAAAAGATVAAPVVGATLLLGMLAGGFYGATGAKEFYALMGDRDKNDQRDIIDKLSNLFFGATSTITTPLPADLNGDKFTIDASLTRDDMVRLSKGTDNVGMAWRYALRELNSFVITDVGYTAHNTDGSLDLYDPATGQGTMTEAYLADRAAMLAWKLQFEKKGAQDENDSPRTGAKPYNEDWDTSTVQGNWDFIDMGTTLPGGAKLQLSIDGAGISLSDHQVVFVKNAETIICKTSHARSMKLAGKKGRVRCMDTAGRISGSPKNKTCQSNRSCGAMRTKPETTFASQYAN